MMPQRRIVACAALMLLLPAARAMRPPEIEVQVLSKNDPYRQCSGSDTTAAIIGCTVIIDARDTSPRNRTMALANRGVAYLNRGDSDRALADLNKAVMLDAGNSVALSPV